MAEDGPGLIDVVVDRLCDEAPGIRCFDLVAADRRALPRYTPGAHIDVVLDDRLVRSYSLIGPLDDDARYRIAVNLDAKSRGGSSHLHGAVSVGSMLRISAPRNHFPLVEDAPMSILVAGGIGITPLWCMAQRLAALGARWELHYACRTRRAAAFVDAIQALCHRSNGSVHLWFDDENEGRPLDIGAIVRGASAEAHLYCCGPAAMLGAFRDAAASESSDRVHLEYFRPAEVAKPTGGFTVELARSGVSVEVPGGCSILDALIMRGIDAPYSCYEGLCGTCETRVLEGIPDHRDQLLSEKAKAENKTIIICCSGSKSKKLVLDL
jgi:vanillate O-demethylase ferredoxin subunit